MKYALPLITIILLLPLGLAQGSESDGFVECDSCESCAKVTQNGGSIRLTADLIHDSDSFYCLEVSGDVTIDCQGYSIIGDNKRSGISLGHTDRSDPNYRTIPAGEVLITACTLEDFKNAINPQEVTKLIIHDSEFGNNEIALPLSNMLFVMSDSVVTDNQKGIHIGYNAQVSISESSIYANELYDLACMPSDEFGGSCHLGGGSIDDNYWGVQNCGDLVERFMGLPKLNSIMVDDGQGGLRSVNCLDAQRRQPVLKFLYYPEPNMFTFYLRSDKLDEEPPTDEIDLSIGEEDIPVQLENGDAFLHQDSELAEAIRLSGEAPMAEFKGNSYYYPASAQLEEQVVEPGQPSKCELLVGNGGAGIDIVVLPVDPRSETSAAVFTDDAAVRDFVVDKLADEDGDDYGMFSVKPFKENSDIFNFWTYNGPIFLKSTESEMFPLIDLTTDIKLGANFCQSIKDQLRALGCEPDKVVIATNTIFRSVAVDDCTLIQIAESSHSGEVRKILVHEMGHLVGLADEYTEKGVKDILGPNCVATRDEAVAGWGDLEGQGEGVLEVGFFDEGCAYSRGNYRPTINSIMNDQEEIEESIWYDGFGLVNERIMARTFDNFRKTGDLASVGTEGEAAQYAPVSKPEISDHYSSRDRKRPWRSRTEYIIIHTTEGGDKGSLAKLTKYGEANYMVATDGHIYRIINKGKEARHAGKSMWKGVTRLDRYSVGIEVVGYHNKQPNAAQIKSLKWLVGELQAIYNVPDVNVMPHSMVAYGTGNRWHPYEHRGRKRCGMLYGTVALREKIGLTSKPTTDPDVAVGRLKWADEHLRQVLYGDVAQSDQAIAQFTDPDYNVITKTRTAWTIAREAWDLSDTTYVFPDGTKVTGDKIDPASIPIGTRVFVGEYELTENIARLHEIGKDADTAWGIAGRDYASSTTIYFLPDGRVRRGHELSRYLLDHLEPGTKMLVGYKYGGNVGKGRTAYDIAGKKWNHPSTFYRLPDGSVVSGDDIDERTIRTGTIVLFME